jgi:hypothetical protein
MICATKPMRNRLPNREGDNFVVHLITLAHAQDVLLAQINQPPNCGAIQ